MVGFCGTSGRSAWRVELAIVATLVFAGGLSGEGFASVCAERTLTLSPPVGSLVVAGPLPWPPSGSFGAVAVPAGGCLGGLGWVGFVDRFLLFLPGQGQGQELPRRGLRTFRRVR